MREPIKKRYEANVSKAAGKKHSLHQRTVLPLPADAVDAAFADGVEIQLAEQDDSTDSLSYAEVVARVNHQLSQLDDQRKQLHLLLKEAGKSLR